MDRSLPVSWITSGAYSPLRFEKKRERTSRLAVLSVYGSCIKNNKLSRKRQAALSLSIYETDFDIRLMEGGVSRELEIGSSELRAQSSELKLSWEL